MTALSPREQSITYKSELMYTMYTLYFKYFKLCFVQEAQARCLTDIYVNTKGVHTISK